MRHTTWLDFLFLPLVLCVVFLATNSAFAAVRYVDANSASPMPPYTNWSAAARVIQDAVDASLAGDEIVVTNGVYASGGRVVGTNVLVNRVALDKPIALRSVNGPHFTIIQGYQSPGTTNGDGAIRCVYLGNGTSLSGFTLTNGATGSGWHWYVDQCGGGVWCESETALVSNCVVTANSAFSDGGGAYKGTLKNCTLTGNSAGNRGGGAAKTALSNCTLKSNSASAGGGAWNGILNNCSLTGNLAVYGGGVYGDFFEVLLNNCTLTGNSASLGGGVEVGDFGTVHANNCIIYFNTATEGDGNWSGRSSNNRLNFCCTTPRPEFWRGIGNIILDPQLASSTHLSADSPCRGAGSAAYTTGVDIDDEAWASPPSIGCDEYHAATEPLSVSVAAAFTNVLTGYPLALTALIKGHAGKTVWNFGDGLTLTNRPYATHAWASPGDYAVALRAFNDSNPGGVSATVIIHVVAEAIHYVSVASVNPVPPYTTWATAATNIQDAVDAADEASFPPGSLLVLVTNGVYASGGRAVVGTMTNRVLVDKPLNVRSVNGPQSTIVEGYRVPGTTNGCGDGAIRCVYLASGASLSGFTLTNGATRGSWNSILESDQISGGGLWCGSTTAVVSNCVVVGNSAGRHGGGVLGGTLIHCTLASNSTIFGGGAFESTLSHCRLIGNSAWEGGGAYASALNDCILSANRGIGDVYASGGGAAESTLYFCTLTGNTAGRFGGGSLRCVLNSCTLTGNSAADGGGGAYGGTLNNCTLTGNRAGSSGGGGRVCTMNNSISYFNTAPVGSNYFMEHPNAEVTVNYCCITPVPTNGVGSVSVPPLFVDDASGNLRLQSNSPCINAGLNANASGSTDLDGLPRIVSGTVDIGAYEFQGPGSAISYAWLQQYGLPTDGSVDAIDADADGLNTWQEWRCWTDPTDPRSVLHLLSVTANGANTIVRWKSVAGVIYSVERSTELSATSPFTQLVGNLQGQDGTTSYTDTDTAAVPLRFYRISVP